mgnify:CR=1 FL=1
MSQLIQCAWPMVERDSNYVLYFRDSNGLSKEKSLSDNDQVLHCRWHNGPSRKKPQSTIYQPINMYSQHSGKAFAHVNNSSWKKVSRDNASHLFIYQRHLNDTQHFLLPMFIVFSYGSSWMGTFQWENGNFLNTLFINPLNGAYWG